MNGAEILNPVKLSRLVSLGFEKMAAFRKTRMSLLREYAGRFYAVSPERVIANPINLIYQATTTMVPNLIFKDPKAWVTPRFIQNQYYADVSSLAMDQLTKEIDLKASIRKAITNSIFLAGFIKVGMETSGQTLDLDGFLIDIGQPYAKSVDCDDMVLDPIARSWEEQRFIGNRFRMDVGTLINSGLYDADKINALVSRYDEYNSKSQASSLSGWSQEADSVIRAIDLVELWIPSENVIVTMPWGLQGEVAPEILRTVNYEGPQCGPYKMLGYSFVPDNIMPIAPAMIWYDLHEMSNRIARKIARQADRQKSVLVYESQAWQDAQRIVDSIDGESLRVDSIDMIKEVSYGGTNNDAYQYMEWAKQNFSEMAMNIDLLSGARSNEPTATQAEMIQANTSVRLNDMQSMVYDFVGDTLNHLFFYLHTDPLIELPMTRRMEGKNEQIIYSPSMREGDWIDYNISVKPFSMARRDPNLDLRRKMEFYSNVIPAISQAYQLMGPLFNPEAAIQDAAREMNIENIDELFNSQLIRMLQEKLRMALEQGVPMDPKTLMVSLGLQAGANAGIRPQQPNPMQQMGTGITPSTERNMMRQEPAAELQQTYLR